jgi:hypothetical protein
VTARNIGVILLLLGVVGVVVITVWFNEWRAYKRVQRRITTEGR